VRREGEGASAGGPAGDLSAAGRGSGPPPAAPPPPSHSLRVPRGREAGGRGSWVRPRTVANANAPTSLSTLRLLRLQRIGGSTDEVVPPGGTGRLEDDER